MAVITHHQLVSGCEGAIRFVLLTGISQLLASAPGPFAIWKQ